MMLGQVITNLEVQGCLCGCRQKIVCYTAHSDCIVGLAGVACRRYDATWLRLRPERGCDVARVCQQNLHVVYG